MEIFELKTFFFFFGLHLFRLIHTRINFSCPSRIHINKLLVPPQNLFLPPPPSRYPGAGPEWTPTLRCTPESNYWGRCRCRPYSNYVDHTPPGFRNPCWKVYGPVTNFPRTGGCRSLLYNLHKLYFPNY